MTFKDGVIQLELTEPIAGTADQAWEWMNCIYDILEHLGRPYPLLTQVKHPVEFTSEARRIMRLTEDSEHFVAHAMCARSLAMKAMVKFLMILVPRNLFDEDVFMKEENARAWMQEKIDQSPHAPIEASDLEGLHLEINMTPRELKV